MQMSKKGKGSKEEPTFDYRGQRREEARQNIKLGYVVLYLGVLVLVVFGEMVLMHISSDYELIDLVKDTLGNLMGVLAAFLIFDIAHEWISKDSYAVEVSEQLLDTLMYHPEALELYENEQKKVFVNTFIGSIVGDPDVNEMISSHLNSYLLTKKDFKELPLSEKECRIKTAFSYRFILETERTRAFSDLRAKGDRDPYFYVQEELTYKIKYLADKGNYTKDKHVKIAFVYDNAALDRFLRGNKAEENQSVFQDCIFRETLDIEKIDQDLFMEKKDDPEALKALVSKMFRPHISIDKSRGKIVSVEAREYGILINFEVEHSLDAMEHDIDIIFHMPKKWNSALEAVVVEPTKDPKISLSYNEDLMDVEMYPFLNKGDASAYENSLENENGVYSISITNEWVFPISGVVFIIKRDQKDIPSCS